MRGSTIQDLGVPKPAVRIAQRLCGKASRLGYSKDEMKDAVRGVAQDPDSHTDEDAFGELAEYLVEMQSRLPLDEAVSYDVWGEDLDPAALEQMDAACHLPVAVRGAVMPDSHRGYGLPIGGVLATEGAVIPWAVGVDIACRMKMTVFDIPEDGIEEVREDLIEAIEKETSFGIGASFEKGKRRDHEVLEKDWNISQITKGLKDKAWRQLGSSGSGNHFVEFGLFSIEDDELGIEPGTYVALLSHSGSRGPGATVANHYADLAQEMQPQLPKHLKKLAWLDMDSHEGQEYWEAMNLMGEYASANHAAIHDCIQSSLGVEPLTSIENHHNFCWREEIDGRELYIHRKGATPASEGDLGVIPGTMTDPAYIVRGKGDIDSLESAAHGAGRVMSRTEAKDTVTQEDIQKELKRAGVTLLSAGRDEAPHAYKNIDEVMDHQSDLVETVARFDPKIVKMAPPGHPAED